MTDTVTKEHMQALRELGPPGHYRVNWQPKLSAAALDDLKQRGLIAHTWTWASGPRPDTSITDEGVALLTRAQSLNGGKNG